MVWAAGFVHQISTGGMESGRAAMAAARASARLAECGVGARQERDIAESL